MERATIFVDSLWKPAYNELRIIGTVHADPIGISPCGSIPHKRGLGNRIRIESRRSLLEAVSFYICFAAVEKP